MKTYLLALLLFGAQIEGEKGNGIRVVPVEATPEPNNVSIHIVFPQEEEVKASNPVYVQLRLEGYPIGSHSEFPRAKEIRSSKDGQSIHILVDDQPFIEIDEAIDDVGESQDTDYDQIIDTEIPFNLHKGLHLLRVFPVRSYGECLKGDRAFTASIFYIGEKKNTPNIDLSKAYLTYNQPQGSFKLNDPVLLDFFISNCQLSKDGYKVRLTIDGSDKRLIAEWTPMYIYGLSRGTHKINLELLDPSGNILPPLFKDTQKTITVH